jgi:hypothetical protein
MELYEEWLEVKKSRNKVKRKEFFNKTKELHKYKCNCKVSFVLDVWFPRYFKREGLL